MKGLVFRILIFMFLTPHAAFAFTLELIGTHNFPHDAQVEHTAFNGLSDLDYDREEGIFYIVSDDRSFFAPARYYTVEMTFGQRLSVFPKEVIFFKDPKGEAFKKNSVDFEGIAILGNQNLLVSGEGSANRGIAASITEFGKDGSFVRQWPIPPQFIPDSHGHAGIRENLGFESLTVTPDYAYVFAANEQALKQDGARAGITNGSAVRIIKYSGYGKPLGQYPYMVSPVTNPTGVPGLQGGNGLVAMLALDEHNLLTLERSWLPAIKKVHVRIFHVNLENSVDVSQVDSLSDNERNILFAQKTLVLDLDSILPLPDSEYSSLDNMEGMTFGPDLPDGSKTILLVSDGNFSTVQRTLFLAFRVGELEESIKRQ